MQFQKAVRQKAKLRLALTGPSGSGKTWGALDIARGIGGSIAVIDTEKGSASLYSNRAEFDVLELAPPFTPERFIEALRAAERAGYSILIIDSITHEWNGTGGCLELVDEVARSRFGGNTWSAWSVITPRHKSFLDALMQSPMHIIATMRSKTETAQQDGANGKKKVVKMGMKAEQRDGSEYEFTVVLDIIHDGHFAVASKDRTGLFTDADPKAITEDTGKALLTWLETGADAQKPWTLPAAVEMDLSAAIGAASCGDDLRAAWASCVAAGADKDAAANDRLTAKYFGREAELKEAARKRLAHQSQPLGA